MVEAYFTEQHELIRKLAHDFAEKELTKEVLDQVEETEDPLEVVVSFAVDSLKWTRKKATVILGLLIFLTGVPSALSFGTLGNVTILNYSVFDFVGMVTDNILLPFGGLAMCYFIGWKWEPQYLVDEVEKNGVTFKLKKLWIFCIRFLTPILVASVTLTGFAGIYSIVWG